MQRCTPLAAASLASASAAAHRTLSGSSSSSSSSRSEDRPSSANAPRRTSQQKRRRMRLLYVAVALSEIDHISFHRLKFQQLCRVTRADAPRPYPVDMRDVRSTMVAGAVCGSGDAFGTAAEDDDDGNNSSPPQHFEREWRVGASPGNSDGGDGSDLFTGGPLGPIVGHSSGTSHSDAFLISPDCVGGEALTKAMEAANGMTPAQKKSPEEANKVAISSPTTASAAVAGNIEADSPPCASASADFAYDPNADRITGGEQLLPDPNSEEDYVDFQMLAFSKEGTFTTRWINDDERDRFRFASPITIPEAPASLEEFTRRRQQQQQQQTASAFNAENEVAAEDSSCGEEQPTPFEDPVLVPLASFRQTMSTSPAAAGSGNKSKESPNDEENEDIDAKSVTSSSSSSTASSPAASPTSQRGGDFSNTKNSSSSSASYSGLIRGDNAIIEGRRDEAGKRTFCLVRVSDVVAFDVERMRHFLEQNMKKAPTRPKPTATTTTATACGAASLGDGADESSANDYVRIVSSDEADKMMSTSNNSCCEDEEDAEDDPIQNQLIVGAHGYGFALGVNVRVIRGEDDTGTALATVDRCAEDEGYYVSISLLDLVTTLAGLRFRSVVFDCCLMSTAQTAAAMYKVAPHVVACEGYMWEEDNDAEKHVLNSYSARYLCFGVDGGEEVFDGHDRRRIAYRSLRHRAGSSFAMTATAGHGHERSSHRSVSTAANAGVPAVVSASAGVGGGQRSPSPEISSFAASPDTTDATACRQLNDVLSGGHAPSPSSPSSAQSPAPGACAMGGFLSAASVGGVQSHHGARCFSPPTPSCGSLHTAEEALPTTALTRALVTDNVCNEAVPELIAVARHFASHSPRGDVAVLNTEAGALLYHHLLLSKARLVPFLHRPASLTTGRPLARDVVGPRVQQVAPLDARDPDVGSFLYDVKTVIDAVDAHVGSHVSARSNGGGVNTSHQSNFFLLNTPSPNPHSAASPSPGATAAVMRTNSTCGAAVASSAPVVGGGVGRGMRPSASVGGSSGNLAGMSCGVSSSANGGGGFGFGGGSALNAAWVEKANELLSATVLFNLPPSERDFKYYTCSALRGLSVKI